MRSVLDSLHQLPPGNPDRIEFDVTTYTGKYAIIGAGTRFGGYVPFVNSAYQVMPEKWTPHGYVPDFWDNIYQGTIFSAIGDVTHEFGHNIGFYHYQGGSYELMHWGGLQKTNVNCPPHINAWQKIVKGWIPNITILRDNGHVQLPPINDNPWVAVVSLFGDPGRNGVWGSNNDFGNRHSEFLIIENRQRSGFNRFSGGEFVPQGFTGGALVWHYSSMTLFPLPSGQLVYRIGMKTVNYGQPPYYQPPNPDHFFPWHGTTLGPNTNPNSNTLANLPTGISLTNIALNGGYLTFDVEYSQGSQPSYNIFISPTDGAVPSSWSGNVYCQRISNAEPVNVSSIAPGTVADVLCKIPSSTLSAQGTLSLPITIQGIGNGSYRYQWTGFDLIPSSPTVFPQRQYCNVRNATVGMVLQPLSSAMPFVRNCVLDQNQIDIRVHSTNPSVRTELAGLDQNALATLQISGFAKLANGNLVLPSTTAIRLGQSTSPADIVIIGNNTLTVTSPVVFDLSATIGGSTWRFDADLTIPDGKTLNVTPGSTLQFGQTKGLVSHGSLSVNGTSQSPVFLTRSGTSGSWLGVNAEQSAPVILTHTHIDNADIGVAATNGSSVVMDHCTVASSTVGLHIVPGEQELEAYKEVISCQFQGISYSGMIITDFSNMSIVNTSVSSSNDPPIGESYGIYLSNASPTIIQNSVEGFGYGLYCANNSSPTLESGISGGYNIFTNNNTGVYCSNGSDPILGFISGAMGDEGGQNSIYRNNVFDVEVYEDCQVYSENNWYGSRDDPEHQFHVDGSSKLFYVPWLEEAPSGSTPTSLAMGGGNRLTSDPVPGGFERDALTERLQGRTSSALTRLRGIIENDRVPLSSRQWAVRQLVGIAREAKRTDFSGYLIEVSSRDPRLARQTACILPYLYRVEGNNESSLVAFNEIIELYPGTGPECGALYAGFLNALFHERNIAGAVLFHTVLGQRHHSSAEFSVSSQQLRCYLQRTPDNSPSPNLNTMAEVMEGEVHPAKIRLAQNFPNPFNPTTYVSYHLPLDAFVTLKVYDMLGKEVATLVDEPVLAGSHSIRFDATGLASGVYFYRLTTGNFTDVKRLLIMK